MCGRGGRASKRHHMHSCQVKSQRVAEEEHGCFGNLSQRMGEATPGLSIYRLQAMRDHFSGHSFRTPENRAPESTRVALQGREAFILCSWLLRPMDSLVQLEFLILPSFSGLKCSLQAPWSRRSFADIAQLPHGLISV